jgi:hypothetical protein
MKKPGILIKKHSENRANQEKLSTTYPPKYIDPIRINEPIDNIKTYLLTSQSDSSAAYVLYTTFVNPKLNVVILTIIAKIEIVGSPNVRNITYPVAIH